MERRGFFQSLVSLVGGGILSLMALVPGLAYLIGTPFRKSEDIQGWTPVGPLADLPKERPSQRVISVKEKDGWQIREQNQLVFVVFDGEQPQVLSSICPHLSCSLFYESAEKRFHCPCHNSFFDGKGTHVTGPSPRDMDPLPSKVEGDVLYCRWVAYRSGEPDRVEV